MSTLYSATTGLAKIRILHSQLDLDKIPHSMQPLTLSRAIYNVVSLRRWNELIKSMFPDMEVPFQKQENVYTFRPIPKEEQTPEQAKRLDEVMEHMPACLWPFLRHEEQHQVIGYMNGYWTAASENFRYKLTLDEPTPRTKRVRRDSN